MYEIVGNKDIKGVLPSELAHLRHLREFVKNLMNAMIDFQQKSVF